MAENFENVYVLSEYRKLNPWVRKRVIKSYFSFPEVRRRRRAKSAKWLIEKANTLRWYKYPK